MKLRRRLENFKGVFARIWFNIAMTSDRLSFASVEINKSYSFTLSPWKNLCHRWSRDQPRPRSLFPTTREAEERDPGNEVAPVRPRRHVVKNAYVRHIFQEKENGTAWLSGGPKLPIHMVSAPVCFGAFVQRIFPFTRQKWRLPGRKC